MANQIPISRRDFIKLGIKAGTGLIIGINLSSCGSDQIQNNKVDSDNTFVPNAWLSINPDNVVTFKIAEVDMGQGVMTALPMLIAEELEVDWSNIKVEHAPLESAYGYQVTGGSDTIIKSWELLRRAGAVAREMLREAAASTWQVPIDECVANLGIISHTPSQKKLSYGELAMTATSIPIPDDVQLKSPDQFKVVGRSIPMLDIEEKVNGTAEYGIDVKLPGMLTATIKHCPFFGGKLKNVDPSKALKIKGVRKIVEFDSAIAVIADNYWSAETGLKSLSISWDKGPNQEVSTIEIRKSLHKAVSNDEKITQNKGNAVAIIDSSPKVVKATYEIPFQAHATMEPMNCTAHVKDGECDIWVSTQEPSGAQMTAFNELYSGFGKKIELFKKRLRKGRLESVRIHRQAIGGGFGRRFKSDFVLEAIHIAKTVDAPVKLIWSREEDLQHDFYRPISFHKMKAAIGNNGLPQAWFHQTSGPKGLESGSFQYDIENVFTSASSIDNVVPLGAWRSVSHSYNAFAIECFIDELAYAALQDPVDYRLKLLKDSRLRHVIELAAEKSNWRQPPPNGHYRGIAALKCFGSYVAQVAEVSIDSNGEISIPRVVCAFDCGIMVNPNTIRAQIEGGIIYGLTATIKSGITIKDGQVEQSNFHDFPLIKISETPKIDIYLVKNTHPPGGVGETPVPPVAPAIANAIYAATEKRVRLLPINNVKWI